MRGSCISLALPKNHECQSTRKYPGKSSDLRLEAGFILDSITCTPFCNLPSIELQLCTYVSNPRTQEAVAGGLPQVQRQPELLNETVPQRTKNLTQEITNQERKDSEGIQKGKKACPVNSSSTS